MAKRERASRKFAAGATGHPRLRPRADARPGIAASARVDPNQDVGREAVRGNGTVNLAPA
jgi:hypothetical protein